MANSTGGSGVTADEQNKLQKAGALAREQLKLAVDIAQDFGQPGHNPDPVVVAGLVQAIATNYALVISSGS